MVPRIIWRYRRKRHSPSAAASRRQERGFGSIDSQAAGGPQMDLPEHDQGPHHGELKTAVQFQEEEETQAKIQFQEEEETPQGKVQFQEEEEPAQPRYQFQEEEEIQTKLQFQEEEARIRHTSK